MQLNRNDLQSCALGKDIHIFVTLQVKADKICLPPQDFRFLQKSTGKHLRLLNSMNLCGLFLENRK